MTRDRTIPIAQPAFAEPQQPRHRTNFRILIDAGVVLTIVGTVFGAGVTYKTFLDEGKRLDQHDQLFQQVIQIEQQQQVTVATLAQTVKDMQDQRSHEGQ